MTGLNWDTPILSAFKQNVSLCVQWSVSLHCGFCSAQYCWKWNDINIKKLYIDSKQLPQAKKMTRKGYFSASCNSQGGIRYQKYA